MRAFGRVLGAPHVPWLMAAALVARLPYGMVGLAILLFVHGEKGSFAPAGAVAAAFSLSAAATLPALGRLIDAIGQTRVMLATVVVQAAAGAALVGLGLAGASTLALVAAASVAGAAVTPVSPALRGLWPDLLGDDALLLRSAMALDAVTLEFVFVGGPLLTAALVAVASPAVALAAGFAFSVAGATAFALSPPSRRWRGSGTASFGLGPLASPGLRTLLAHSVPFGLAFGALEVALPAFGVAEGSASAGALAIAALSAGSVVGGVLYGARPPRRLVPAFLVLAVTLPVGMALLALPSSVAAMLLVAPLAGAALAPLTAVENELAGRVAPAGTVTEAYAWVLTATVGGLAIGTAVAGALVEAAGWRATMLAGAAAGLAGASISVARRGTLRGMSERRDAPGAGDTGDASGPSDPLHLFGRFVGSWDVESSLAGLTGRAEGDRIVQLGHDLAGPSRRLRWTFSEIEGSSFRWTGEVSTDGGATWRMTHEMRAKRRT